MQREPMLTEAAKVYWADESMQEVWCKRLLRLMPTVTEADAVRYFREQVGQALDPGVFRKEQAEFIEYAADTLPVQEELCARLMLSLIEVLELRLGCKEFDSDTSMPFPAFKAFFDAVLGVELRYEAYQGGFNQIGALLSTWKRLTGALPATSELK
jgi:hypothetical protein